MKIPGVLMSSQTLLATNKTQQAASVKRFTERDSTSSNSRPIQEE